MNHKQLVIISIVIVIGILACLTTYMIVNSHSENYTTLRISSSCTVNVPLSNNTEINSLDGITTYTFPEENLNITHQKSANNSKIKYLNSKQIQNSEMIENNIYYDESSGIYSVFIENNMTGDSLLITSDDLNLLKNIIKDIVFTNPVSIITDDTEIDNNDSQNVEIADMNTDNSGDYSSYNYRYSSSDNVEDESSDDTEYESESSDIKIGDNVVIR